VRNISVKSPHLQSTKDPTQKSLISLHLLSALEMMKWLTSITVFIWTLLID